MSRGPGKLQVELLRLLEASPLTMDTFELAAAAYAVEPDEEHRRIISNAQISAAQRGLAGLAKAGKAVSLGRGHNGRGRWANNRVGLPLVIQLMQLRNQEDGQKDRQAAVLARVDKMMPLIRRARELGIDIHGVKAR
jgi:hypothetical protein